LLQQFWLGVLLQNIEGRQLLEPTAKVAPSARTNTTKNDRFLIYHLSSHPGQGTGNIISGVLAAHMLADEFNRIVCHVGYEQSFDRAFVWKNTIHASTCQEIISQAPPPKDNNTIVQNNFDESAIQSECAMKEMLRSSERILYYKGNTYPRWPSRSQGNEANYFDSIFRPTPALRSILPWPSIFHPPPVVVHLRQGDNELDNRDGLDHTSLTLLAQQDEWMNQLNIKVDLSHPSIFLVTNRVEFYDRFPNWTHPNWSLVHHSALGRISWGSGRSAHSDSNNNLQKNREDGLLQMWADWYTLLHAKAIIHTHSDFSLSAARWNSQIRSWTIQGTDEGTQQLHLQMDFSDERSSAVPRLVDRSPKELKFCNPQNDDTKEFKDRKVQQTLALMKARRQQRGVADALYDYKPNSNNKGGKAQASSKPKFKLEKSQLLPDNKSFLIYHHQSGDGQGVGNVISGVLAAHLLAEEFNRTVCHYGGYRYESSMGRAFRWKHQCHSDLCANVLEMNHRPNASNTIVARNYDHTRRQSECNLKNLLSNHDEYRILYYHGNTYPRWPTSAISLTNHRDYFHDYYAPTQTLLDILPWNITNPPLVSIHLRQGDGQHDQRAGLDDGTLSMLANYSYPIAPFLVTNRVDWYNRFPNSWSHPNWDIVQHSEFGRIPDWGGTPVAVAPIISKTHSVQNDDGMNPKRKAQELGKLQMWADWYTLLCTQQEMYHTHSDFSLSAARWNRQFASWTILGSNGSTVVLQRDFEQEVMSEDVVPSLAERTSQELKFCGKKK
jgi:hypothetical protein